MLHSRARALERANADFKWIWSPKGFCSTGLIGFMFLLYLACSLFVIATFPWTPYSETIPNWVVPAIVASVLLFGVLYYFIVFWASASESGLSTQRPERFNQNIQYPLSILSLAGIKCVINKVDVFDTENDKRARRFGSRRRITYQVSDESHSDMA